jgi:hypothetical protein
MSVKSERRKEQQKRKAAKKAAQATPGQRSNYARKRAWEAATGRDPASVPEPKPWK